MTTARRLSHVVYIQRRARVAAELMKKEAGRWSKTVELSVSQSTSSHPHLSQVAFVSRRTFIPNKYCFDHNSACWDLPPPGRGTIDRHGAAERPTVVRGVASAGCMAEGPCSSYHDVVAEFCVLLRSDGPGPSSHHPRRPERYARGSRGRRR